MAVDFSKWIEDSKQFLEPPVCNRLLFAGQLKVMVVGGPNTRRDYHLEAGEEFFLQLRGAMCLAVVEHNAFRDVPIGEHEMFVLPGRVSHSPQRQADTLGLVIERERQPGESDGLRYFVRDEAPPRVLYEEYFACTDLGVQLRPVIERYFASEAHRTNQPTAASTVEAPPIAPSATTAIVPPQSLPRWREANRDVLAAKHRAVVYDAGEFTVEALVGGAAADGESPAPVSIGGKPGLEVLVYSIEGKTSLVDRDADGTKAELGVQWMYLLPAGHTAELQLHDGAFVLTFFMDPAKKNTAP